MQTGPDLPRVKETRQSGRQTFPKGGRTCWLTAEIMKLLGRNVSLNENVQKASYCSRTSGPWPCAGQHAGLVSPVVSLQWLQGWLLANVNSWIHKRIGEWLWMWKPHSLFRGCEKMCSSNHICWGSDCGGDLDVMRKWKCLPGGEEQLSTVAREAETLPEGSALIHGAEGLWGSCNHVTGLRLWGQGSDFSGCRQPWGPSCWTRRGVFLFPFLPPAAWPAFAPSLGGCVVPPPIAFPSTHPQGWCGVKHPSPSGWDASLQENQGQAEAQPKT